MYLNEKLNTKNGFFMVEMGGLHTQFLYIDSFFIGSPHIK